MPELCYHFSQKGYLPEFLNNTSVTTELGNIAINGISRSSYIYIKSFCDPTGLQGYPVDTRIADSELGIKLVNQFNGQMNRFLNALWFLKDNSVCTDGSQYVNDVSKITLYNSMGSFFSSGSGKLIETKFSEEELTEAVDWYAVIGKYTVRKKQSDVSYKDIMTIGLDGKEKIRLSSFSRSLLYLNSARKNFFIPGKIASYTSLLETLFAIKDQNTEKVSKRLSIFIGDSKEEELLIYKNMKKIYDIRSSYVHGSDMKNNLEQQLLEYSSILDTYIRITMRKILYGHDELNYGKGTKKKFNDTNSWFEELVSKKRYSSG